MIYIPNVCGNCKGINNTLSTIYDIYEKEINKEYPRNIYLYNDYIFSDKVKEELRSLGIQFIDNTKGLMSDDVVILASYGCDKKSLSILENGEFEFHDTTCTNIKKMRNKLEEKYREGYDIIIIGDANSTELKDTLSYCDNSAIIMKDINEIDKIENNDKKKYIICESSFNKQEYQDITSLIKSTYSKVEVSNTSCNLREKIITNSEQVMKECEIIFVIGNDSDLVKRLEEDSKVYVVNSFNDLKKIVIDERIDCKKSVGITASFNVPQKEIDNYKKLLSFMCFYNENRNFVEEHQDNINEELTKNIKNRLLINAANDLFDLNKASNYFRAVLVSLGERLTECNTKDYLHLGYAYELNYTANLIHLDIIKNQKYRRGKMTIPRRICDNLLDIKNENEYQQNVLRLANSQAILVGDLGFTFASNLILNHYNNNLSKILSVFNDTITNYINGEILDANLSFCEKNNFYNLSEEEVMDMYTLKRNWESIIGPISLGFAINGKNVTKKLLNLLNKIGTCLYLKNDIDSLYNTDEFNKLEFKESIIYSHAIKTNYKDELIRELNKKDVNKNNVINIVTKSDSLSYAKEVLENLIYESDNFIDDLLYNEDNKELLKGLLYFVTI